MLDQLTSRKTLYEAFEHVREKGGCRGVDGVSVGEFQANLESEIDHLQDRLIRRRYHPLPLLRFQVRKSETKLRSLSVPTVRDRVVQTAVHRLTREIFETEFEDCSYAFREGRSVKDAVHRIDELRRQGFRWVVDADIEGFSTTSITTSCSPASAACRWIPTSCRFSNAGSAPRSTTATAWFR